MKIKIRKATLDDVDSIVSMWHGLMRHHRELVKRDKIRKPWHVPASDAEAHFRRWVKKWIRSPNGLVLVAEADGDIAGYALNQIKDKGTIPVYRIQKLGYMSDLYVKPGYRGKGISSRLKTTVFQWFRKNGVTYVDIGFHVGNTRAQKIYRLWGFAEYTTTMRRKV